VEGEVRLPEASHWEPGEVNRAYWERTVAEAFKCDPIRIIIELIKNAADSYTRLEKRGEGKPPYEIFVTLIRFGRKVASVEVLDRAQGMDSQKLKEALMYGAQTSMGEDLEAFTSAEKGIGLKDAMMALKNSWLITIKDGLINERTIRSDFKIGFGREGKKISRDERKSFGIKNNGTIVTGELPDYFHEHKFETICEHLQKHFIMRKLLQCSDYRIHVVDNWTHQEILLKYDLPEIDKQILKQKFNIDYIGREYAVEMVVNKARKELDQRRPYGDSGLLLYYGGYSVIDLTLCGFERDPSFAKIFGEAKLKIEDIIKDRKEAPIVDEKRRGLNQDHPFNKKLTNEIYRRLRAIREEESSKYSFDEEPVKEIIRELNKLYREIKGRGLPPEPPIRPEFFEFYPVYASVKENEPRTVYLIINSSLTCSKLEISLVSKNPKIVVKPATIIMQGDTAKVEFISKQVELYSEERGIKGEVIATAKTPNHAAVIGVEVVGNPVFSPSNGFAFVPDRTSIVDGGEKDVSLCIDKNLLQDKEIVFSSQDPVSCPGKLEIPDMKNAQEKIVKNTLLEEIPIQAKGINHIGEKATITATYGGQTANLSVVVMPEPSINGLFRGIQPSAKDTKKISDFVEEEGILEVYYKHPLIRRYMVGNYRNSKEFQVFFADVITREVIKTIVRRGVRESSTRFPIFDMSHAEVEIEDYMIRQYYDNGPKLHGMFMKLARAFQKIEE
jgi:hypothetical protein